jgi:hypothetical protein
MVTNDAKQVPYDFNTDEISLCLGFAFMLIANEVMWAVDPSISPGLPTHAREWDDLARLCSSFVQAFLPRSKFAASL